MPDPAPTPQPDPQKPKAKRGLVNQKNLDALDKASLVATAARKDAYGPKLSDSEIDAALVAQLEADIAACKARIANAVDFTSDVRSATAAEARAQDTLAGAIKSVQAAAKQKYARTSPEQTKDYFVGEEINTSRARVLQVADVILQKLTTDTLPGVNAAKIANLKSLRDAYAAANAGQGTTQTKASSERNTIEDAIKSITDRRVQIQFAADGIWQSGDKANAPIRREFQLPVDRPFTA